MANEINGSDLFMWLDDVLIANATSHTLSFKMSTRDTSNKDSGTYNTRDVARFDVSGSCDGLVVYSGGYKTLIDAMKLRTPVKMDFGQKESGLTTLDTAVWYASGMFVITGVDITAGDQENATYTCTFEHQSGFDFTPHAALNGFIVGYDPASAAAATAGCAVYVWGGIEPYTYVWTFTAGGAAPTVAGKCVASACKAAVSPGTTYTCTITDSSVPALTLVLTKLLVAAGA
jgi:hypothetical protein